MMISHDTLFNPEFPGAVSPTYKQSIGLRAVDNNDTTNFITKEGFLQAFYQGEFAYCIRNYLSYGNRPRYTITSISYHLPTFEILRCVESMFHLQLLCKGSDWWASIDIQDTSIEFEFGVDSLERGRELSERFSGGLETIDVPNETVTFEVWAGSPHPFRRRFPDLDWMSIEGNYPLATRRSLEKLMNLGETRSAGDGRIILFHGPPGTGKTYAIRALLTGWKSWIEPRLVFDPENLLEKPGYMLNILNGTSIKPTQLIVIEDADEIVVQNGVRSSGLSRLLNAADGLVGANNDILFLLTTNAKPGALDSALLRAGRSLATIEFGPFPVHEANERLGKFGPTQSEITLAEIFRFLGDTTLLTNERPTLAGQYL